MLGVFSISNDENVGGAAKIAGGYSFNKRSSSDQDHGTINCFRNLVHTGVRGFFSMDRAFDERHQLGVRCARAKGITKTDLVGTKKTHAQISIGRKPQPIASSTEILAHRRYETETSFIPRYPPRFGGMVRVVVASF